MSLNIKRTGAPLTMELRDNNELKYLVFPRLEELGIVDHLFSTRLGGVSTGYYSECNLSYTRGDDKQHVDENYTWWIWTHLERDTKILVTEDDETLHYPMEIPAP